MGPEGGGFTLQNCLLLRMSLEVVFCRAGGDSIKREGELIAVSFWNVFMYSKNITYEAANELSAVARGATSFHEKLIHCKAETEHLSNQPSAGAGEERPQASFKCRLHVSVYSPLAFSSIKRPGEMELPDFNYEIADNRWLLKEREILVWCNFLVSANCKCEYSKPSTRHLNWPYVTDDSLLLAKLRTMLQQHRISIVVRVLIVAKVKIHLLLISKWRYQLLLNLAMRKEEPQTW